MIVSVLKIIGITILIILAIIILILGIVLFVPIRYHLDGKYDKQLLANGLITWFPILLKVTVDYHNGKVEYIVKMFGGVIMTNLDIPLSWLGRRFVAKESTSSKSDTARSIVDTSESARSTADKSEIVKIADDAIFIDGGSGTKVARSASHYGQVKRERMGDTHNQGPKRKKHSSFLATMKIKFKEIRRRITQFIQKLKQINDKKDKLLKVYRSKRFAAAKQDGIRYIRELFRILKPKKADGYVHFGMNDPASTGQILGIIAMFIPLYDSFLQIQPDFDKAILEGKIYAKGNIYLFSVVKLLLKIILNKNLIKVIKKVQTIIEA